MKLYTEEQVRKVFYDGIKYASSIKPASIGYHNQYVEGIINSLTPIELPSDEEIEQEAYYKVSDHTENPYASFKSGANWMKEQILNQNK